MSPLSSTAPRLPMPSARRQRPDGARRRLLAGLGGWASTTALAGCSAWPAPTASTAPGAAPTAAARFDPMRRTGPTPWEAGNSRHYRFERRVLPGADGTRYRLWLAWPRQRPPAGHPLLCLLDGNAVADTLTAAQLDALAEAGHAPALVAIGPDSDLRFDVDRRAYDYTPPVRTDGPTWDDAPGGRRSGGADAFLDFIAGSVLPLADAASDGTDPARRTLWGHSYGGLFVLHALLRRPAVFDRYAAADPSLWWQDGFILREAKAPAPLPPGRTTRLLLMQGSSAADVSRAAAPPPAASAPGPAGVDAAARRRQARAAVPPDSGLRLVAAMNRRPGLQAEHRLFADVAHGPMLAASLPAALALAALA